MVRSTNSGIGSGWMKTRPGQRDYTDDLLEMMTRVCDNCVCQDDIDACAACTAGGQWGRNFLPKDHELDMEGDWF